jgi:hypothetical protein
LEARFYSFIGGLGREISLMYHRNKNDFPIGSTFLSSFFLCPVKGQRGHSRRVKVPYHSQAFCQCIPDLEENNYFPTMKNPTPYESLSPVINAVSDAFSCSTNEARFLVGTALA